jgi:hypothetical protein
MSLTPTLSTPGDVMAKMAREHVRAINSHDKIDASDHLYNFCITSLAMRDHLLEHLGIIDKNKQWNEVKRWASPKVVTAAHDIGNSSKHFVLRDKNAEPRENLTAQLVDIKPSQREIISLNPDGSTNQTWIDSVEFNIIMNDAEYNLWDFMSSVREFWEARLIAESVPFEKVPHRKHIPFTS